MKIKILSSLAKVFADQEPQSSPETTKFTALLGETFSFQVAIGSVSHRREVLGVHVESPFGDKLQVRTVELVPSSLPAHADRDENYVRGEPGMFPDLLKPLSKGRMYLREHQWQSLWIDIDCTGIAPGEYPITVSFYTDNTAGYNQAGFRDGFTSTQNYEQLASVSTQLTVYKAQLPPQKLIHTEWFHADCLADYYNVDVFSEQHWQIMERFIRIGVKRGLNMILTPTFTPPLDTDIGGERTTVQLVGVARNKGQYQFDFAKLDRWIDMCHSCGIRYFEIAHLFTQWGATCAPKVMASENGALVRIFGWDTPAVGGEYTKFLDAYLPSLIAHLKKRGVLEHSYFHVSDEPTLAHLQSYSAAVKSVEKHLEGLHVIDALSAFDFYKNGLVRRPIPASNHIEPFLQHKVPQLWTYYCTSQGKDVSNRFMAMPSERNRIIGVQLYKFDIEGFLHWGFNFYNTQYSQERINPYSNTDAGGAFPSGDAFLVYPGKNGEPEESIRMMVFNEALQDLRALQLLESFIGKEKVVALLEENLGEPISFSTYPQSAAWLLQLRNKVNGMIQLS